MPGRGDNLQQTTDRGVGNGFGGFPLQTGQARQNHIGLHDHPFQHQPLSVKTGQKVRAKPLR
jgi:hypothetical protein